MKKALLLFFILNIQKSFSQPKTGLILREEGSAEGYVLFAPLFSKTTYLIDKFGKQVHTWQSSKRPNQSVYLLPNGQLLRTTNDSTGSFSGGGGGIEKLDWNSKIIWSYRISDSTQRQHHDICPLPNGNILVLVCDKKSPEQSITKGRDPKLLGESVWSEKIIELKPKGKNSAEIIWEWYVWDHLVQDFDSTKENYGNVSKNPQLFNINYLASKSEDWLHFNSIAYNNELKQILVSNRNFNEVFIIEHGKKNESRSHSGGQYRKGGDLLYRWGNSQAYNYGDVEDQKLYKQHSAHWIAKGLKDENKIMIFNNGLERPAGDFSSVEIIEPIFDNNTNYKFEKDFGYLPDTLNWIYTADPQTIFYSRNVSNAQRLYNGNTLICEGANGVFFEIDSAQTIVWKYVSPVTASGVVSSTANISQNQVFRCSFYQGNYSGFKKHKLISGKEIELNSGK
ncbi:aryl-sulfate sulfotransferase [Aurantibacillus circumpalustris]|uniref:aryl-sulfate sulfotransferase n=1 Tax=Aurantibacillus circumpalustris TaxID=3036359 RepID=UPI00295C285E|nr:aryl-sulfate sulfotransferase [Aurantibacillus circumpalustris]